MKITISLKPATAGSYSAPDMGTALQMQYSDDELAERDKEEKARQEKEAEAERKEAAEKQKKDAAKAPKSPAESGEDGGDSEDEESDDSDDSEDSDDSDEDSDDSDEDSDDSDDDDSEDSEEEDEEEEDDDDGDEEATASSSGVPPLPYPEARSSQKPRDFIPAETTEKVVDQAKLDEENEAKEAATNKAREHSKDDPNLKKDQKKGPDQKSSGQAEVATAASLDFTMPYPDVKIRRR